MKRFWYFLVSCPFSVEKSLQGKKKYSMSHVNFFEWLVLIILLGLPVQCSFAYGRMKPRTTRALRGLVAVSILVVTALLGSLIAQTHSISLTTTDLSMWLIVDYFVVQAITQWTLLTVQTRQQRIISGVITGAALAALPLWALVIDILHL